MVYVITLIVCAIVGEICIMIFRANKGFWWDTVAQTVFSISSYISVSIIFYFAKVWFG